MSFLKVQSAHLHQVLYPELVDAPDAGKLTTYIKVSENAERGGSQELGRGEGKEENLRFSLPLLPVVYSMLVYRMDGGFYTRTRGSRTAKNGSLPTAETFCSRPSGWSHSF